MRINDMVLRRGHRARPGDAELVDDPLIRCLFNDAFGAYQAAQLRRLSAYNQPPKEILDVMRAPAPPSPSLSPTRDKLMLVTMEEYPSIAKVATPFLRLAGVRIEPGNHSQHDTPGGYGIPPCVSAIDLVQVADGKQLEGETAGRRLPAAPGVERRRPALRLREHHRNDTAVELWVGDAKPAPCAACLACA
jgi:hypothetical protein